MYYWKRGILSELRQDIYLLHNTLLICVSTSLATVHTRTHYVGMCMAAAHSYTHDFGVCTRTCSRVRACAAARHGGGVWIACLGTLGFGLRLCACVCVCVFTR